MCIAENCTKTEIELFHTFFSDELSILPHSQSDPVSLQPTKASDLLLQTVIPEVDDEPVKPPSSEPIVIEANGPALMQESDECPILETTSDVTCPVIQDESKLETSMSSSRTTLVSAIDPSSSPPSTGIKLDSTLTEEDQETMIEDAMKVRMMVSRIFSRNLLIFTFSSGGTVRSILVI